jgi:hypothetical protein
MKLNEIVTGVLTSKGELLFDKVIEVWYYQNGKRGGLFSKRKIVDSWLARMAAEQLNGLLAGGPIERPRETIYSKIRN